MRRWRSDVPPEVIEEYQRLQREMAERVRIVPLGAPPRIIAGVDVHLRGDTGIAAAVAMRYPGLEVVEERVATETVTFPYIPGLLSFREAPACLKVLGELAVMPDLLLIDGQGRAHPRRFGIACHIGVELDLPAIGVAKSVLTGRYGPLGEARGSTAELVSRREVVGMAVRSRDAVSPLIVSVGNLITLQEAVEWTLRAVTRFRLPEPSRRAHLIAKRLAAEPVRDGENQG